jgi:hypothetical protein
MAVHVGVGSAGKEHDLAIAGKRLESAAQVAAEGGMGTVLDPKNIYNQLMAFERAAGTKGAGPLLVRPGHHAAATAQARPRDGEGPGPDAACAGESLG